MEVLDIIKERRSVRAYTEEPVDKDKLDKLVEAAVWAPSGGNIQAWAMVILQQKAIIEQMKAVSPGMKGNPTALMILCTDRAKAYDKGGELARDTLSTMDISIAAQNICLEATALGLGSCIVRSFNSNGVAILLDLPNDITPELVVCLGYASRLIKAPPRRTVKDAIFRWIKPENKQ